MHILTFELFHILGPGANVPGRQYPYIYLRAGKALR